MSRLRYLSLASATRQPRAGGCRRCSRCRLVRRQRPVYLPPCTTSLRRRLSALHGGERERPL